jgi:hypothetical protein
MDQMSLIRSGLMGGTAINQKRVHDPISLAIAGAIVGQAAVGTAIYYTVAFAAAIAVNAVVSFTLKSLATKESSGSGSRGLLVNATDPTAPREYVYGRVRKGGVITYYESTGSSNQFLHMILVVAGHEIDGYESIMIDDKVVTIDGSNFVTSHGWDSKIRIKKYTGTATQTTDPDLLAESAQVTSAFRGRGIAYLYIRLEYDPDVFVNGIPLFTAIIRGKKVLDTRTSTTAYSSNWALCVRDYLVASYGFADVAGNIDTVSFNNAANISDENVSLGAGGTIKRYEIDGVISADESVGDVLRKMMTAACGTLFWGTGKWRVKPGYYSSPVKSFTTDNLRSAIKLQTKQSARDNFNIVRGKFNDEDNRFIEADYPEIKAAGFITEDNGKEKAVDLPLPFTTKSARAQRLAKMSLFRSREQMAWSAAFDMTMFGVEVGDTIQMTVARYGWTNKVFEVTAWQLAIDPDTGELTIPVSLRETSSAAFSWSAEESTLINNDTNLPDPSAGLTVSGLTQSSASILGTDGRVICSTDIDWTNVTSAYLDYYMIQWKKAAETRWDSTTTTNSQFKLNNLVEGTSYNVRVQAVTTAGNKGPWSSTLTFTPNADTTAPAAPTGFVGFGIEGGIQLFWVNSTVDDFKVTQIYSNTTNTTTGATKVGQTAGETFVLNGLARGLNNYYFLRSKDQSGNIGAWTAGVRVRARGKTDNLNLVPDDEMLDPGAWSGVAAGAFTLEDSSDTASMSDGRLRWIGTLPVTALELCDSDRFRVKPGQTLYISGQVNAVGGDANVQLAVRFRDKADAVISVIAACSWNLTASSGVNLQTGEVVVPALAVAAQLDWRLNSCTAQVRLMGGAVYKKSPTDLIETDGVQRTNILDAAVTDKFQDTLLTATVLTTTLDEIGAGLRQTVPAHSAATCLKRYCSFEARAVSGGQTLVELQIRIRSYSAGAYDAWKTIESWTITNTSYDIYTDSANLSGPYDSVQYRLLAGTTILSGSAAIKNMYLTIEESLK